MTAGDLNGLLLRRRAGRGCHCPEPRCGLSGTISPPTQVAAKLPGLCAASWSVMEGLARRFLKEQCCGPRSPTLGFLQSKLTLLLKGKRGWLSQGLCFPAWALPNCSGSWLQQGACGSFPPALWFWACLLPRCVVGCRQGRPDCDLRCAPWGSVVERHPPLVPGQLCEPSWRFS